jgi:hypothetical protein
MQLFSFAVLAVLLAVASALKAAGSKECSTQCDSMKLDVLTLSMCRYVVKKIYIIVAQLS